MPSSPGTSHATYDVAVVGGGIVGVATALAVLQRQPVALVLLEAEHRLAAHQSGRNSGVIHSGLYYKPGSLKARLCVEGRRALYEFCAARGIAHERCGKLVVAGNETEAAALDALLARGQANGLRGLTKLNARDITSLEPHVAGVAGIHIPDTGIVDFAAVTDALADEVRAAGGDIHTGARVVGVRRTGGTLRLRTMRGVVHAQCLINCGGLQCDRIARMCGVDPKLRIVPFRGEFYRLLPHRRHVVRNLVYPVPDPRFPFLGIHVTRTIHGDVEVGPNAVPALRRDGYHRWSFSLADTLSWAGYRGFHRLARVHWRTGLAEFARSASRRAFAAAVRRLIPTLAAADLVRARSGVRAQAVDRNGALVDDFRIIDTDDTLHVLNAPSPAATAAIAVGRHIARTATARFGID